MCSSSNGSMCDHENETRHSLVHIVYRIPVRGMGEHGVGMKKILLPLIIALLMAGVAHGASTGLTDCSGADNSTAVSGTWDGGGNTDGEWQAPNEGCSDDTTYANITNNGFDKESSYVLYAENYGFSVSGTITGVKVKVNGYCTNGSSTIDLLQLLSTAGARTGTNAALADPQTMTTSSAWTYSWGGDGEMWGLSLTDTWVNDVDFGVALGVTSGNNNQDHFIDYIQVDVFYTTGVVSTRQRMNIY